jgi:hypothetical protein
MKPHTLFVIALLSVFMNSSAQATFITTSTVIGGGTFSPSNKVSMSANSDGTNYSVKSKHLNGDRRFGSSNQDPKIHYISSPVGATVTDTVTPTFNFSAWTSL